jgi:CDGSH-type Zn-finger protein
MPIRSTDGTLWEIRNRETICRCGKSRNMPFCDGSDIDLRFIDGNGSLRPTADGRRQAASVPQET